MKEVHLKRLNVGYSIITEAELWAGIKSPHTPQTYRLFLHQFQRYSLTVKIARRTGELHALLGAKKGSRISGISDCIIAATAEHYQLTICSRNSRDFNPFVVPFAIPVETYTL